MDRERMLEFQSGKIAFMGRIRTPAEYGINIFRIDLPNYEPMYGEWRPSWAENGYDFDIKIMSFGYPDAATTSNGYYNMFSQNEKVIIENLIRELFKNEELRKGFFPFSSGKSRFLDGLTFASGWLVLQADYDRDIGRR